MLSSEENTKKSHFWHFNDQKILWALIIPIFHFCISRPSKFNCMGHPFALCSGLLKTQLHAKDDIFKPADIDIFFLQKTCQRLAYNMFCSQFNTNLAAISLAIITSLSSTSLATKAIPKEICVDKSYIIQIVLL